MTRSGLPDYGMYAALENMGNLVDYGELAARLGSIAAYNREGNLVFWDDFENTPLKWNVSDSDPGSSVDYSSEQVLSGGQAVKLVTGNVIGYKAGISRIFPRFATGKIGTEIAFSNDSADYKFTTTIYMKRETYWFYAKVRVDFENDKIELYANDSQWHDVVTDMKLASEKNLFHHLKVVMDNENGTYVRILIDRHEYNVEEYSAFYQVFPTIESYEVHFDIKTYEVANPCLYLDNFILTQNEP